MKRPKDLDLHYNKLFRIWCKHAWVTTATLWWKDIYYNRGNM